MELNENNVADYIRQLISIERSTNTKQLHKFYKSKEFVNLRHQILTEQHNECYYCKRKGIIKRYDFDKHKNKHLIQTVHHINEVRHHPELALSKTYIDELGVEQLNLVCICKRCHNEIHQRHNFRPKKNKFVNDERW